MALAGNIQEFGLADIFQIVSLQQKTGELIVEGGEGKVSILLENGFIVGADATFRPIEERLQQSLVRSGKINKFQLKKATENQKKTLQPLWTVLAELGEVDLGVLQNGLSQQIHETVYHLLRWTEGKYRFEPKKNVEYDRQLMSPINTEFLVMEGFRITDEWSEIEKVITAFDLVVRQTPGPHGSLDDLSQAETKVYTLLEQEHTIQEVIDSCQLGEFDTCQTIYELIKKNLVERVKSLKGKTPTVRRSSVGLGDLLPKVVTILVGIGILAGVVIGFRYVPEDIILLHKPGLTHLDTLKRFAAQSQLHHFSRMISLYFFEYKKTPESLEELKTVGMINSDHMFRDPWGNNYIMSTGKSGIVIRSAGKDEKAMTDDDISVTVSL